uniref:Uncharacterized protein n=1 Tax=Takifugu rubripes TaxID=31033 RepID=A0A674MK67_TAKRU
MDVLTHKFRRDGGTKHEYEFQGSALHRVQNLTFNTVDDFLKLLLVSPNVCANISPLHRDNHTGACVPQRFIYRVDMGRNSQEDGSCPHQNGWNGVTYLHAGGWHLRWLVQTKHPHVLRPACFCDSRAQEKQTFEVFRVSNP